MASAEEVESTIIVLPLDNSGSSDIFGGSDVMDTATTSPPLPSLTHDTSRTLYHMKDLNSFANCLENSARRAFPNQGRSNSRYKSVEVLLLCWEEDDLGVVDELDALASVLSRYGFSTEKWLIPSDNSHLKLTIKAANFVEEHDSEDCLLIVYYSGHALINSARQSTWQCKRGPAFGSISLEWSAIQTVFEKAASDVLLLLDCCFAASAAPMAGRAITETIAACGWEEVTPEPGRCSFTNALIEVLGEWYDHCFSAAMLHSKVLSVLKHERPELWIPGMRRIECRRTPVYILTTAEPGTPSINLSRLQPPVVCNGEDISGTEVGLGNQTFSEAEDEKSIPSMYDVDELNSSTPTGDLNVPHVLISLALREDQELDAKVCSEWLAAFPALAKYASVKGVYKSHSTLLIASVPVVIWDLLPENPACSFIGYVTSENILDNCKITAKQTANIRSTNLTWGAKPKGFALSYRPPSPPDSMDRLRAADINSSMMQTSSQQQNEAWQEGPSEGTTPVSLSLLSMDGTFEQKTLSIPYHPLSLRIGHLRGRETVPTPSNGFFTRKLCPDGMQRFGSTKD